MSGDISGNETVESRIAQGSSEKIDWFKALLDLYPGTESEDQATRVFMLALSELDEYILAPFVGNQFAMKLHSQGESHKTFKYGIIWDSSRFGDLLISSFIELLWVLESSLALLSEEFDVPKDKEFHVAGMDRTAHAKRISQLLDQRRYVFGESSTLILAEGLRSACKAMGLGADKEVDLYNKIVSIVIEDDLAET